MLKTRRRIDWEAAKTRIFSILMERARRDETGLSNKEIRQITLFNRNQVSRMMLELRQEHKSVLSIGYGAGAKYIWQKNN